MTAMGKEPDLTIAYYSRHAQEWAAGANAIDMSGLYGVFEPMVPTHALILDVGCGSGRDARHFAATGHKVIALDPCLEMLQEARRGTPPDLGRRIRYMLGSAINLPLADCCCSAVWACASLLHLPRPQMPLALAECHRVLMPGGVVWISVKAGKGEQVCGGRRFTYWEPGPLARAVEAARFSVVAANMPAAMHYPNTIWLGVLASKV